MFTSYGILWTVLGWAVLGDHGTTGDYMSYGDTLTTRGGYSVAVLGNPRANSDYTSFGDTLTLPSGYSVAVLGNPRTISDYTSYGDTLTMRGGYSVAVLGPVTVSQSYGDTLTLRGGYSVAVMINPRTISDYTSFGDTLDSARWVFSGSPGQSQDNR